MRLKPADTVVEIGCGTGLNFRFLAEAVGFKGKKIGVDLTDKMLAAARDRIARNGWSNVELVQADAATYLFPHFVNAMISTFAMTLIDEYEDIIHRGVEALAPKGRMVIADLRKPDHWPIWIIKIMVWLTRPFGTCVEIAQRTPWKTVKKNLTNTNFIEFYGGFTYISSGEKL